jgi:hypothetical protein
VYVKIGINDSIDTIQIPQIPILGYTMIALGVIWIMPRWMPVKFFRLFRPAWRHCGFDSHPRYQNKRRRSPMPRCQDCTHLEKAKVFSDRDIYRCQKGHYDLGDGTFCFYALSGITRPNKAVRLIQEKCTDYQPKEAQ